MVKRPVTTLLIGLGGSGAGTLVHVKRQLYDAYNNQIPENVALAVLDTAKTVNVGVGSETVTRQPGMGIGRIILDPSEISHIGGDTYNLVREIEETDNYPHIKSWFLSNLFLKTLPRAIFQLDQGAGMFRQFGRLALFRDVMTPATSAVVAIIDNKLRTLARLRQSDDPAISVMIVGSLAGGTGAGLFIDVAHLVQRIASINNINIAVRGFFYLPQAFRGTLNSRELEPARARAFAAMRELKRFMLNSDYRYGYPMHYHSTQVNVNPQLWRSENQGRLYDFVYLFDGEGQSGMNRLQLEYGTASAVADAMVCFIDENYGPQKAIYEINTLSRILEVQAEVGRKPFVSTLGAYSIIMPIQQIIEGWAYRLSRETLLEIVRASAFDARGYITEVSNKDNPEQRDRTSRDEMQRLSKSFSPVPDPFDNEHHRQIYPLPLLAKVFDIYTFSDTEADTVKRLNSYNLQDWLAMLIPPQQQNDQQTNIILAHVAKVLQDDISEHVNTSDEIDKGDPSRDWKEIRQGSERFVNAQLGMPTSGGSREGGQYRKALNNLTQLQLQRFCEYMTAYAYNELNGEGRYDIISGKTGKLGWLIAVFEDVRAMLSMVNLCLTKMRGFSHGINNRRAQVEETMHESLLTMQDMKDARNFLGRRGEAINAQKSYISSVSEYIDYYRIEFARDEVGFTIERQIAFCDQVLTDLTLWRRILATDIDSLHNKLLNGTEAIRSDLSRAEKVANHRVINDARWEDNHYAQYVTAEVRENVLKGWHWNVDLEDDGEQRRFSLSAGLLTSPDVRDSKLLEFQKDVDRPTSNWSHNNVDIIMKWARGVFRSALDSESVLQYLMDEKGTQEIAEELALRSEYLLSFDRKDAGTLIPGTILLVKYDDKQSSQLNFLRDVIRHLTARRNHLSDQNDIFVSCADSFRLTVINTAEYISLEGIDAYANCEEKYWETPSDFRQKNHIFPAEVRAVEYEEQLSSLQQKKRLLTDSVTLLLEHEKRLIDFLLLVNNGLIVQREIQERQILYYWALTIPSPNPKGSEEVEEWRLSDAKTNAPSLLDAATSFVIIRADKSTIPHRIDEKVDAHISKLLQIVQENNSADRIERHELALNDVELRNWLEVFMPPLLVDGTQDLSKWKQTDDDQFLEAARLVVSHDMLQEMVDEFKQYLNQLWTAVEKAELAAHDGASYDQALMQRELCDLYSVSIIALEKQVINYRDLVRQRYIVKTRDREKETEASEQEIQYQLVYLSLITDKATSWQSYELNDLAIVVSEEYVGGKTQVPVSIPEEIAEITVVLRTTRINVVGDTRFSSRIQGRTTNRFQAYATWLGQASISADIFAEGHLIDTVELLNITVSPQPSLKLEQMALPPLSGTAEPDGLQPDLTIRVYLIPLDEQGSVLRLLCTAYSQYTHLELEGRPVSFGNLPAYRDVPASFLNELLKRFQDLAENNTSSSMLAGNLKEIGRSIWNEILPPGMREVYKRITVRDKQGRSPAAVRTILFITDEFPWLPYELAVPKDIALCEEFEVSRWIEGLGQTRRTALPLSSVYRSQDADLSEVISNYTPITWGEDFGTSVSAANWWQGLHPDSPIFSFQNFTAAGFLKGKATAVILGNERFDWRAYLHQQTELMQAKSPIVMNISISDIRGGDPLNQDLLKQAIQSGAIAVVGTWWSVLPMEARVFSQVFYESIDKMMSLGEAVFHARQAVKVSSDYPANALAFFVIGDPTASGYSLLEAEGYLSIVYRGKEDVSEIVFKGSDTLKFDVLLRQQPPAHYSGKRYLLKSWDNLNLSLAANAIGCELDFDPKPVEQNNHYIRWTVTLRPREAGKTILSIKCQQGDSLFAKIEDVLLDIQHIPGEIIEPALGRPARHSVQIDLLDTLKYRINNENHAYGKNAPKKLELQYLRAKAIQLLDSATVTSELSELANGITASITKLLDAPSWDSLDHSTHLSLFDKELRLFWEIAINSNKQFWGTQFALGHIIDPQRSTRKTINVGSVGIYIHDQFRTEIFLQDLVKCLPDRKLQDISERHLGFLSKDDNHWNSIPVFHQYERSNFLYMMMIGSGTEHTVDQLHLQLRKHNIVLHKDQQITHGRLGMKPVIFLNLIKESADAITLDTLSFIYKFLLSGASAVVAPICTLPYEFSCQFSHRFLDQLLKADGRSTIGTILMETRDYFVREQDNPLGLAFVLFGDPEIEVRFC